MVDTTIVKRMVAKLKENGATIKDLEGFGFENATLEEYCKHAIGQAPKRAELAQSIRRFFLKEESPLKLPTTSPQDLPKEQKEKTNSNVKGKEK